MITSLPKHLTAVVEVPAKVNLLLHVTGKRDDGYHEIYSLFQAVSLFDRLEITRVERAGVSIETTNGPVHGFPLDASNLISQAYHVLQQQHNIKGGIAVRIDKRIPIAAGLAGGSADAAGTIAAVSALWDLKLGAHKMAELGLQIGSDLPFFFGSGMSLVTGRGENVQAVELPTDYWLVLVTPDLQVSTAEAYGRLSLTLTKSKNAFNLASCRTVKDLFEELSQAGNDFEPVQFASFPVLKEIFDWLVQLGAAVVRMSGSGPTLFGLFETRPQICGEECGRDASWQVQCVQPVVFDGEGTLSRRRRWR
jgi:4-diphosphocytidyl-2-C-methyl-D-erythritol kinase